MERPHHPTHTSGIGRVVPGMHAPSGPCLHLGHRVVDLGPVVTMSRPEDPVVVVGHEGRIRLTSQPPHPAEVVGVGVGGDDTVDSAEIDAGFDHRRLDHRPRRAAGQSRVDHCCTSIVRQDVHVDVTESGESDWELDPQDPGGELGHAGDGTELLLLLRHQ